MVGQNPLADDREMVFVSDAARTNRSLRQVATAAEVTAGTLAVDRAANRIYLGEDPAGKTIEVTSAGRAFNVTAPAVVRGLGFTHFGGDGLTATSRSGTAGLVLERNAFVWNARVGTGLVSSGPDTDPPPTPGERGPGRRPARPGQAQSSNSSG